MNVRIFAATLAESLIDRGIDSDTAKSHVLTLVRSLSEEDLAEISAYNSAEDFVTLSDSLSTLIRRKKAEAELAARAAELARDGKPHDERRSEKKPSPGADSGNLQDMKTKPVNIQGRRLSGDDGEPDLDMMKTKVGSYVPPARDSVDAETADDAPCEIYIAPEKEKTVLTARGKAFFWTIGILTLPLSAGFCAAVSAIFAVGFAAVSILLAACFVLIGAEAIAGSASSLVGVIYGIIQIFTTSAGIGLYEIGIGVVCAGASLILGVLTYNFAVLVLPYVLKQLAHTLRKFIGQIRPAVNRFREECNKL